jgi:hypothetical protein
LELHEFVSLGQWSVAWGQMLQLSITKVKLHLGILQNNHCTMYTDVRVQSSL